jgi:hypothetical protein
MPYDFNETIRLAVEKISAGGTNIRDHHEVEEVLKSLDHHTELIAPEEFKDLVYKTVAACERSGIKMPDASR